MKLFSKETKKQQKFIHWLKHVAFFLQQPCKDYADGIFKACEEGRKNDKNTTWLDGQANILLKQMTDTCPWAIEPLQKEYDKLFV